MNLNEDQFSDFNDAIKRMKSIIRNAWNDIEEFLHEVEEVREDIEVIKRLRKTWHVPKNIIKSHQIIDRKPTYSRIRNSI